MSLIPNKHQGCYFYKINRNISDELFCKLKFSPQCISFKEELCYRSGLSNSEIAGLENNGMITFSNIKWKDIPEYSGIKVKPFNYSDKVFSGNSYDGKTIIV